MTGGNHSSSLTTLRLHNQKVIQTGRENPFESHDVAETILNRPIKSTAKLSNAQTIRKYDSQRKLASTSRLIPVFQHKKFNKMRGLLPQIGSQRSLIEE